MILFLKQVKKFQHSIIVNIVNNSQPQLMRTNQNKNLYINTI